MMIRHVTREGRRFLAGVCFLTRIPLPRVLGKDLPPLREAAPYFGAIGALIGALIGAFWLLAGAVLPAPVAAGIAVIAGLLLTGALHEDGLADTFDALGASSSRERFLEILRDSRIGTYGASALATAIGLRWAMLASSNAWEGALALVLVHATGRSAMVIAAAISRATRSDGLGKQFSSVDLRPDAAWCLAVPLVLSILVGWTGLLALVVGILAGGLVLACVERRIRGYTGDVLGAIGIAAELGTFAVLVGGPG